MLALLQAIWLKGSKVTYVTKELMLVVMIVEEGIQVNWSVFLFNNLYCRIGDCSASSKSKETTRKESEFGPAQVVDILPGKWFDIGTVRYRYRKIISTGTDYRTKPISDAQKLEYL
jgi:hypothetical protein